MKKQKISIKPHPDKVLIKVSKKDHEELFFKWIKNAEGKKVQLFTDIEAGEGFDKKFMQNVSCGTIIAVGVNVKDIYPTDVAILDYMVSNDESCLVGVVNGDRIVALDACTTYHDRDAPPSITMRKAHVKGDYDELSKILGVVRQDRLVSFSPYIFLSKESNLIVKVNSAGIMYEEEEFIVDRTVLSAFAGSGYKAGDKVTVKESDLFFKKISGREISICYYKEILGKK